MVFAVAFTLAISYLCPGWPSKFQVVQQMQQQQNMQMNMMMNLVQQVQTRPVPPPPPPGPPATPPPTPAEEAPPDTPGGGAEVYHGSEQGVRMCSRCGKVAYLREGVCFNLDCVSWLH